jgi:[protein-PII] uridylyltransferase
VTVGVVAERDIAELEMALDFVWRVRDAMHLATKSHQDQLTFELQDRLAPTLGFPAGKPGVEAFMRTYYGHAGTIARFAEAVVARCVAATEPYRRNTPRIIREGMRIQGRTLTVIDRDLFAREPAAVVTVFAEAQRHGVTIAPATRDLVRESLPLLASVRDEPAVAEAVLTILTARGHVYETLFEMHRLGVLKEAIPEFGNLDCLIAHDPFHIYTVDQHSLIGVRELERPADGRVREDAPAPHAGDAGGGEAGAAVPRHDLPRRGEGPRPRSLGSGCADDAGHRRPARPQRGRAGGVRVPGAAPPAHVASGAAAGPR